MLSFVKNRVLLGDLINEPHAFGMFRIDSDKYSPEIIEEIAIGQSLGAWDERFVSRTHLEQKSARIVSCESRNGHHWATVAFPWNLWHGQLSWLLAIVFGKYSFYQGVQLADVWFQDSCFAEGQLTGPVHTLDSLRANVGATQNTPLLMGILKPNVAMPATAIATLFEAAAEAGIHMIKDDEIRHDASQATVLERVAAVANLKAKKGLKSLYFPHLQLTNGINETVVRSLEQAGADGFLLNVWTDGLSSLQQLRGLTNLPIMAHPALVGAFGTNPATASIHPKVTLARLLRAAGADFSLFPSPYGKLGLARDVCLDISEACLTKNGWSINETIPVPSAGIMPEHAPKALADFGSEFVLNAGTAIFASGQCVRSTVEQFLQGLRIKNKG